MKLRFPARPGFPPSHLSAQVDYILSRYSKALIASSIVVSLLYSSALLLALLPGGFNLVLGLGILVMLIYLGVVIELAGNMAQELGSGEASIYLATPLSRVGYIGSWLLSLIVPLTIAFLASMLVPLLVIDPGLAMHKTLRGLALGVAGEIIYYSTILLAAAALFKRKNLVSIFGLFMLLIGPVAVMILSIIYFSVTGTTLGDETMRGIIGLFHPVILFDDATLDFTTPVLYSLAASTIIVALTLRYATSRLEV